jgi:hypothetical protein
MAVTSSTGRESDLERQRAEIEADFREGWVPTDAGQPRALTAAAYAQARKIVDHGGLAYLDFATIQAVREGAQPGDPLPPTECRPSIDGVGDDVEVIIVSDAEPWVAVLFSHAHFPGVRFGHRISAPSSELARYGTIWLKEEVETGALHRMMQNQPPPDDAGIIWTSWRGNR